MGFYTKNKVMYLPNKKVIDDLLERSGSPNKESFTPYNGMNNLIGEQSKGKNYSVLNLETVKASIHDDVHVTKLKGTSGEFKGRYIDDLEDAPEYKYTLEEIDESHLRQFVLEKIIGSKEQNKSTVNEAKRINQAVQANMYDLETGEIYKESSTKVRDNNDYNRAELIEAREKIPYLLKKLQDGSKYYGVSLLSLFMARDKLRSAVNGKNRDIKPRELLACGIYLVGPNGDLAGKFDSSPGNTTNNTQKFIIPRNIVLYEDMNNPYFRAGSELTALAKKLGYPLHEENIEDYTPSLVNNLINNYIVSNQEVLADMSYGDPRILELFKNSNTFFEPTLTGNVAKGAKKVRVLREMAASTHDSVIQVHKAIEDGRIIPSMSGALKLMNRFFDVYREIEGKTLRMEETCTSECNLVNETLCDLNGNPLLFRGRSIVQGMGDTEGQLMPYFILTERGYLIKIEDNANTFNVTTVLQALNYIDKVSYQTGKWVVHI